MVKSYYLETSVIRSRLVGHTQVYNSLVEKLKDKTCLTSKFVQMEFDRGFVRHLIAFYFVLKDSEKISDALKWWAEDYSIRKTPKGQSSTDFNPWVNGVSPEGRRAKLARKNYQVPRTSVRGYLQIKNLSYSYAEVFSGIEDNDVERAVFKLREHIRQICDHFQFLIHRFEKNQTDCYFQQVTLNFDSFDSVEDLEEGMVEFYQAFDEKHHAGDCQIVQLFDVSKDVFKKMVEHSTKEKGFNRQKENIEKIEKKELDLSCTTCMKIGDTVIALECPEYAILLTHDKAFEGLCQIFDLKHEIIPSLRAEKPTKEVLERLRK